MHVFIGLVSILSVWIRGDYKSWRTYYPTMQYMIIGNLLYQFICSSYLLWSMSSNVNALNNKTVELIHTFTTFPLTVLMFLSHFPEKEGKIKILRHYLFWIGIYIGNEFILMKQGNILYEHGWSLGWSALFVSIMFPFLYLHHKKPITALILKIPIITFLIWYFKVPIFRQ